MNDVLWSVFLKPFVVIQLFKRHYPLSHIDRDTLQCFPPDKRLFISLDRVSGCLEVSDLAAALKQPRTAYSVPNKDLTELLTTLPRESMKGNGTKCYKKTINSLIK